MVTAIVLVAILVADSMAFVRPSAVSAAACLPQIVAGRPDAQAIVDRHHEHIGEQAGKRDLPPELVAAVIYNHQYYQSAFRNFTDCFGSALGANLSLGLGQIRLGTAANIDGRQLTDLSASEFRALRARLLDAKTNIEYEAKELRALLDRANRYPGINADELVHDPFAMVLVTSEYRMGRQPVAKQNGRLNANAFNALRVVDEMLETFGRKPDEVKLIRTRIRLYLDYIDCESGIFNDSACAQRSEAGTEPAPR